jgi:hypothetical protein
VSLRDVEGLRVSLVRHVEELRRLRRLRKGRSAVEELKG